MRVVAQVSQETDDARHKSLKSARSRQPPPPPAYACAAAPPARTCRPLCAVVLPPVPFFVPVAPPGGVPGDGVLDGDGDAEMGGEGPGHDGPEFVDLG